MLITIIAIIMIINMTMTLITIIMNITSDIQQGRCNSMSVFQNTNTHTHIQISHTHTYHVRLYMTCTVYMHVADSDTTRRTCCTLLVLRCIKHNAYIIWILLTICSPTIDSAFKLIS